MSRFFAPAPPQAAAQTPTPPKCPAVANGSPGKIMEACEIEKFFSPYFSCLLIEMCNSEYCLPLRTLIWLAAIYLSWKWKNR